MADILYAYEKASEAVRYLTTHKGGIKERLVEACHYGFGHVDRGALPNDLKSLYDEIRRCVKGEPDPRLGAFSPAIDKLSEDEAQHVARLMDELASKLGVASRIDH